MAINILAEIISPNVAMALTSGPSQPEVQTFEPVNTSEMVDLFSGDFKYNIPLMDVGGYPININYNSGINMDQEASWVGLGWNLNVGAITRNMRGIPDDFDGSDQIEKEFNMKDNNTFGATAKFGFELFGWDNKGPSTGNLSIGLGVRYNNYTGISMEQTRNIGLAAGNAGKSKMNVGLGISSSADEGLNISPSVSFDKTTSEAVETCIGVVPNIKSKGKAGVAMGYNSRAGLKTLSFSASKDSKKEGSRLGVSTAGVVNFGVSTYVPNINFPMVNSSVMLSMKFGTELFGQAGTLDLSGYFSNQSLSTNKLSLPAYGYFNSQYGQNNKDGLMDFNREKDGGYSAAMQNLPVTNFSYDVYSVAGQGVGGAYRPFRSEVGNVFDNEAITTSDSYNLGVESGVGSFLKVGLDVSVVDVFTRTGNWTEDNTARTKLKFSDYGASGTYSYEPYYFKEVGEKSVNSDDNFFGNMGGFDPVRIRLKGPNMAAIASTDFSQQTTASSAISSFAMPTSNYRSARDKRNQVISTLSIKEARNVGFLGSTKSGVFYKNDGTGMIPTAAKDHHLGEISVVKTDGSRYIYGLPAYNLVQKEVSFNVTGNTVSNVGQCLVDYTPSTDASLSNSKGVDHFYNKVTTPPYAHSYMLTSVVSSDYVDVTSDGPTDDDMGNYTEFKYEKINDYEWRTPVGASKANYNENTKSAKVGDDYASYVYGSKTLYYLDTIKTKNYIAIFERVLRDDGISVQESGSTGSTKTKYLKSITLYSKRDYYKSTIPVPIKKVNFEYDYSLCLSTPNSIASGGGKLTLKKIYFTYGISDKAKESKYEFTYSSNNPNYDPKAVDRWGNYKPNTVTSNPIATTNMLPNWEYAYVDQNKTNQDSYSSSWSLTKITLPSGADINVTYESDDYAYVQNLPAMDMFKVTGIFNSNAATPSDYASTNTGDVKNLMSTGSPGTSNQYIYFKLKNNLSGSASQYMKDNYLKDMFSGRFMYFKFLVNMTKRPSGSFGGNCNSTKNCGDYFEYVSGYAELDLSDYGFKSSTGSTSFFDYGYVKLKDVDIGKNPSSANVNPISKAAWQTGRLNYPQLVWDANFDPQGGIPDVLKALVGTSYAKNLLAMFKGPNMTIAGKDYGKEFIIGKSWIRLYDPDQKKLGGGCRVSKLTIDDRWDNMTNNNQTDFQYGQQYEYTVNSNGVDISSGVASYEPMSGGDENPFRLPNYYKNQGNNPLAKSFLVPADEFYVEEPFGESFFPSPNVGYSNVKVYNLVRKNGGGTQIVKTHATGYVIHKFYTAKDYPTLTKRTVIDRKQFKPPFGGLFKISARDFLTASQGYVIEVNDMHGKPKGMEVYAESKTDEPISKVEYYYKTQGTNGYQESVSSDFYNDARLKSNALDNTCAAIDANGQIVQKTIGIDFDMVADFRESQTETTMGGAQGNLSVFLVGIFPLLVPTIWPDFSYEKSRFRSAVVTKVINRYGILEKTVATDAGSRVETNNLAYDAETGEVLLTQTTNEFNDPVYSFTYPAHWQYQLMGQAYKNIGVTMKGVGFSGGVASISNANTYFNVGDELYLLNGSSYIKVWVCNVSSSAITVSKADLTSFTNTTYDIKVIRSGKRNQQVIPVGNIVTLTNPINYDGGAVNYNTYLPFGAQNFKVINASATEYNDQWHMLTGHEQNTQEGCCELNSKALNLYEVMKSLATTTGNQFYTNAILYDQSINTYYYGCNNSLVWDNTLPGLGWLVNGSLNSKTANFLLTDLVISRCNLTAILPASFAYNWDQVQWNAANKGFISVKAVENNCAITGMEICANFKQIASPYTEGSVCFTVTTNCFNLGTCKEAANQSENTACTPKIGDNINPFVKGVKGNWRPQKAWAYLSGRKQTNTTTTANTDIRTDGYFETFDQTSNAAINFQPFWKNNGSGVFSIDNTYWTNATEITKYGLTGAEVENKDALGRYSSALYGYNQSLPILVASNAKYTQVANDNFEDYNYKPIDCRKEHFNFYEYKNKLSTAYAHTGVYSMTLAPDQQISSNRTLLPESCSPSTNLCSYGITCKDALGQFSPSNSSTSAQKYVMSFWIKQVPCSTQTLNNPPLLDYQYGFVDVYYVAPSSTPVLFTASNIKRSPIIDGWQRIEYTFDVPASTTNGYVKVSLKNISSTLSTPSNLYFDDIRIHPFNSNVKTFVYNPVNLRYVAELDANNFASFYEYDEEGSLIRVKKETERGIMTIKENKNHTKLTP